MISFRNTSVRRGPNILVEPFDLTLFQKQRVGITGANGCGKSSLLEMICGHLEPDSGELIIPPRLTLAYVRQETSNSEISALDFVLDGDQALRQIQRRLADAHTAHDGETIASAHQDLEHIDGFTAEARAARLLNGLGFGSDEIRKPVREFSGGWRVRLNLAQALMCRSDLLLLDEPTNHLDLPAIVWLEDWLKHYKGTLLLISHDRDFLDAITTDIWHIERANLRAWKGNYSAFETQRSQQLAVQQAAYGKQQQKIEHLQQFIDRFRAKATKAKQAQSRVKALEKLTRIAPAHLDTPFSFRFRNARHLPHPLLSVNDAMAGYNDTLILRDINLTIQPGDRIGLIGPNGAGKSTLIKMLSGADVQVSGQIQPAEKLRTGYFAQHQLDLLQPEQSPVEHIQTLSPDVSEQDIRDYLGGFAFNGDQALQPAGQFSGGEKSRLVLAGLIWQQPNLLLLDEPTNHLDLEMREALTEALQLFEGALIVVSHDRHLLRTCTDELMLVANGGITPYDGSLDDYSRWLQEQSRQQNSRKSNTADGTVDKKSARREAAEKRKRLQPLTKKIQGVEKEIEKIDARLEEIDTLLSNPAIYESGAQQEAQQLNKEKSDLKNRHTELEDDWLVLTEELETANLEI